MKDPPLLRFGDGICDSKYNNMDCCFDNNDCYLPAVCPTCPLFYNNTLGVRSPFSGVCNLEVK